MSKTPVAVSRKRIWIEFLSLFSPQKKSEKGRDWVYPSFMELLKKLAVISKWTVNWDSGQDFLFICLLNENAGDRYDNAPCERFLAALECGLRPAAVQDAIRSAYGDLRVPGKVVQSVMEYERKHGVNDRNSSELQSTEPG